MFRNDHHDLQQHQHREQRGDQQSQQRDELLLVRRDRHAFYTLVQASARGRVGQRRKRQAAVRTARH